ncbi:MAG TPA: glycine oxidase ThiO [Solirubrobacteraceae bacterium]|nr:glycine oxidase ThiO [Solirubrobacteraceae bacterium]
MTSSSFDVAVAGGGAIGLACAWRAAQRGLSTVVLDSGDPGAWQVAAGMLAPVTESQFGEAELLELNLRGARDFEAFCAELAEASDMDPGLLATGTLAVARDRDDAEALERLLAFRRELGLDVERLRPSQARRAEPALAPTVRLALDVPGDHSVDPRRLVTALAAAVERAGGTLQRARVKALTPDGLQLDDGDIVTADQVVLATGATQIELPEEARVPVRPVKGQILRLRDPRGPGLVERTIRGLDAYLVPRADGGFVLGATMEERGHDIAPTAGGVYELLRDMSELVPGVLELEIEELRAGLRPATPDNLPAIGPGALDGLLWATGHYRNGIVLAPVTADLIATALTGGELPEWAAPADPRRFAQVAA